MTRRPLQSTLCFLFRKHKLAGFTLVELLVALLIGGIATSTLLTLVVQLLQTEQRESTRNNIQSEMQAALDYISQDLREAVYVYAGDCLQGRQDDSSTVVDEYCPGVVNHISTPTNSIPVLAFWKSEPLPGQCQNTLNQANDPCQPFRLASRTYSLIVYFLARNQSNDVWQGRTRITRSALNQFSVATNGSLSLTQSYVNPTTAGTSFRTWPRSKQANGTWSNLQTPPPLPSANFPTFTLVDFVDFRGNEPEPCDPSNTEYITSPSSNTLGTSFAGVRSFYACVRVAAANQQPNQQSQQSGLNQDVIVYLRGNTSGKQSVDSNGNFVNKNSDFLPILQTQVLGRGVVDKQPPPPQ